MSKRLVHMLEELVDAMFKDVAPYYTKVSDWERDRSRTLHELAVRGQRLLTIDLPALRKHLYKCLGESQYTPSNLALSGLVSRRVQVPAFLRNLYLQVFTTEGKLRLDPSPSAVANLAQLLDTFGKLKVNCKESYIAEEAKNFQDNEQILRRPSLNWLGDQLADRDSDFRSVHLQDALIEHPDGQGELFTRDESPLSRADLRLIQMVCDRVSASLGDFHDEDHYLRRSDRWVMPAHGKGRVSNLPKQTSKYAFVGWTAKLEKIFPYDLYGRPSQSDIYEEPSRVGSAHEAPSKLIAVPKTATGPRLIASEPVAHQWIQQLIRYQLEAAVEQGVLRHCIDFRDQSKSQELAKLGSIDGSYATVDLKSASDRLSCWTVERMFRANIPFLERIHASRTRTMLNALGVGDFGTIVLKKCFTQGSACTFPVQTVAYAIMCISAVLLSEGIRDLSHDSIENAARKVRVFGDDLIIPSGSLSRLVEILEFYQLKVNSSKTFHEGPFRESCGLDAFLGVDVTPGRIKAISANPSHEQLDSILQASNNLFRKGMWNTAAKLDSLLLKAKKFAIRTVRGSSSEETQKMASATTGVRLCASGTSLAHLRKKWCDKTHQELVQVDYLTSNSKKHPTNSALDLSEFLLSNANRRDPHFLVPFEGELGVVHKQASVMRRGWKPTINFL